MNSSILRDLYRYEGERCKKLSCQLRYLLGTPSFQYVYVFRKASQSRWPLCRAFWYVLLHVGKLLTNIQIPVGTQIGEGLRILHFGHIVINPQAVIGRNFNVAQGVLIGNSEGKKRGVPVIGNNVYCGANSLIMGGVNIGNDVLIAPGAFVNFDVPDQSVVIGNPGKIIRRDTSPTAKYIIFPVEDFNPHP